MRGTDGSNPAPSSAESAARRAFTGTPDQIASDIRNFAAIGLHELIFDCRGQSITESIERLQWFAAEVIPLTRG
jgi:hypothetical protein